MADKIQIDVLTLDSVQCAACGYMMESIAALPKDVQEMIEYSEWSIKVFLGCFLVGSSRVDLQACKLEYSIVSPK